MNELILMLNAIRLEIRNLNLHTGVANAIAQGNADEGKINEASRQSKAMLDEADQLAREAISNSAYRENYGTG